METKNYLTKEEINIILHKTSEISHNPYKLFTAFAISSLFEVIESEGENEEEGLDSYLNYWGFTIPVAIVKNLIEDLVIDFKDAIQNQKQISVFRKNYSIRKAKDLDYQRLYNVFDFEMQGEEYLIDETRILNLSEPSDNLLDNYENKKQIVKSNKSYLRKVIKMAEDDENEGWDKLTDMEIAVYCWALYANQTASTNFSVFLDKYKNHLYVSPEEIASCLNSKGEIRGVPVGMNAFDCSKIRDWNHIHNQKSIIDAISDEEADQYWYDVAVKKTFRPIVN